MEPAPAQLFGVSAPGGLHEVAEPARIIRGELDHAAGSVELAVAADAARPDHDVGAGIARGVVHDGRAAGAHGLAEGLRGPRGELDDLPGGTIRPSM